jgi:AraC-like DNA-binding protein
LGYAPTTLKRRLIAEGSTYQSIKNAVRRDSAIYHLAEGEMSIDDIALAAGFADPPSFFRAFKRWTGTSPRAYMR